MENEVTMLKIPMVLVVLLVQQHLHNYTYSLDDLQNCGTPCSVICTQLYIFFRGFTKC